MWEYKDATDEQLAEASARFILSNLKNDYYLHAVTDCISALSNVINCSFDEKCKLEKYRFDYDKKNDSEIKDLLYRILDYSPDSSDNEHVVAFLKEALANSPEYLLTLRRSETLLTYSTQLYSDDYSKILDTAVARVLDNSCDEVPVLFDDSSVCSEFENFIERHSDISCINEINDLIAEDDYASAFELLITDDFDLARNFLQDSIDSSYFVDSVAYDVEVENFSNDIQNFNIPIDKGFIEFANGIGWRDLSGAKLFNLDKNDSNYPWSDGGNLLYNLRSCDGDRTTEIIYRVGEPFLSIMEYSHDAPTGTSMTLIPEDWLDDALKFKDIRVAFQKNQLLRDILMVKDFQVHLDLKAKNNPLAASFKQAVKDELDRYSSLVDYFEHKGFEDLAYDAGLRVADSSAAIKQPKEVLSGIYQLLPEGTFVNSDWPIKQSFEESFFDIAEKAKQYQAVR